ncbi:MAG: ABC transporter permease [Acidobacteria bacterium]|nr:ABC transporter permease [Acidobacteriota bacterium]
MRTLIEDLRCGMRILRATPGLTLTAIFTLALGIAANTTVFGWIDEVLLNPIPGVTRGGELASLETVAPNGTLINTAYRDYRDYRDRLRQFSGLAASLSNAFTIGGDQEARLVWGEFVSANYFSVMGVKAARGRTFLPEEAGDAPGGPPVAVISDRLWQSEFQRDPRIVGRKLRVNQRDLTIVGVLPPAFRGTVPGLVLEVWIPVALAPDLNGQGAFLLNDRNERQMWIVGRLAPGVAMQQARAEVLACARRMAETNPDTNRAFSATLLPIWLGHNGAQSVLRTPLRILMAVCIVLFLIVGANVANLQLARGATRHKEFAIRLAMGARPARLFRQLLTESLLLASAGAAAGSLLCMWSGDALVRLLPPTNLPIGFTLRLNWHILVFTILLCMVAAVITGLAPALHSIRAGMNDRLKDSSRSTTAGRGARRTRSLLVIAEVALALVAVVGTGLFARAFFRIRAVDPGMDPHNVLAAKYYVETFCRTREDRTQFCLRLGERLRATPGVTAVSYSNFIPLEFGDDQDSEIEVEGYLPPAGRVARSYRGSISPGYFDVLRIPLLAGRDFREQDDRKSEPVMIVNQAFAQRFFGSGPAVGRKVRAYGRWLTVVGLARDIKYHRLTEGPTPYFYTPVRQTSGGEFWMAFFVRTNGPARNAITLLEREAAAVNPATRAGAFVPYEEWIGASMYAQRVSATLLGVIGAVALLLSAVGLYSVLAFAVSQRTQEFGIRIALGALPRHVLGVMLKQGLGLILAGLAAGSVLLLALVRLAASFVPALRIDDFQVFAGAVLLLGIVGMLASYLPALRATRVDPVVALRRE